MAKKKKPVIKAGKVKKAAVKKPVASKVTRSTKKIPAKISGLYPAKPSIHKIYIESAAFFPANSSDGYVDHFQAGRRTAVANRSLLAPIVLPVGAVIKSMSIHYTNNTKESPFAFFLRKHQDRHSPSGEIEMSFISMPPGSLPPDDFLTVTDASFPDGGTVQDKFLHYLEVSGTGDFGDEGRRTIRGVSVEFLY